MFGANLLIKHVSIVRMLVLAFSSKPCRAATHGEVTYIICNFFYSVNVEKYIGLWFCLQSLSFCLTDCYDSGSLSATTNPFSLNLLKFKNFKTLG